MISLLNQYYKVAANSGITKEIVDDLCNLNKSESEQNGNKSESKQTENKSKSEQNYNETESEQRKNKSESEQKQFIPFNLR